MDHISMKLKLFCRKSFPTPTLRMTVINISQNPPHHLDCCYFLICMTSTHFCTESTILCNLSHKIIRSQNLTASRMCGMGSKECMTMQVCQGRPGKGVGMTRMWQWGGEGVTGTESLGKGRKKDRWEVHRRACCVWDVTWAPTWDGSGLEARHLGWKYKHPQWQMVSKAMYPRFTQYPWISRGRRRAAWLCILAHTCVRKDSQKPQSSEWTQRGRGDGRKHRWWERLREKEAVQLHL